MSPAAATLTCTHCTQPLPPSAAYCSTCGTPTGANPYPAATAPPPIGPPATTTPPQADRTVQAHAWLLVAAAAATLAGFYLPWITAQAPFTGQVTANGTDFEAWVPLGGAAVLALLALQAVTSEPADTRYTWLLALLTTLATALFSVAAFQAVTEQLVALDNQAVFAGYGIGVWVIAAGILVALIATVGGWGATHRALTQVPAP